MIKLILETLWRAHSRPTTIVKIDLYVLQGKIAHITFPLSQVKQRYGISHMTPTSLRKNYILMEKARLYEVFSLAPSTKSLRCLLLLYNNGFQNYKIDIRPTKF